MAFREARLTAAGDGHRAAREPRERTSESRCALARQMNESLANFPRKFLEIDSAECVRAGTEAGEP